MGQQIEIPEGWFPVSNALIDYNDLPPSQLTVLFVLLRHRGQNQTAFLTQETIARKGKMKKRTVIYALQKLKEKGLVYWERQNKYHGCNEYWILDRAWCKEVVGRTDS